MKAFELEVKDLSPTALKNALFIDTITRGVKPKKSPPCRCRVCSVDVPSPGVGC
jgi:hypothetical protein